MTSSISRQNNIAAVSRPPYQREGIDKFQFSWYRPFFKTLGYGGLYLAIQEVYLRSIPYLLRNGYLGPESSLLVDVCIIPLLEETLFRGVVSNLIQTVQLVMHRVMHKYPPTFEQLEAQVVLRVNIQAGLFAIAHPDALLFKYCELGRAAGYLFESKGLPHAILCHAGHNLLSYTGHSIIKMGVPERLVDHHFYYMYIFWRVLKKPILPLPSTFRRKLDAVCALVLEVPSSIYQRGLSCFKRAFFKS